MTSSVGPSPAGWSLSDAARRSMRGASPFSRRDAMVQEAKTRVMELSDDMSGKVVRRSVKLHKLYASLINSNDCNHDTTRLSRRTVSQQLPTPQREVERKYRSSNRGFTDASTRMSSTTQWGSSRMQTFNGSSYMQGYDDTVPLYKSPIRQCSAGTEQDVPVNHEGGQARRHSWPGPVAEVCM
jgi:hypothetical protein